MLYYDMLRQKIKQMVGIASSAMDKRNDPNIGELQLSSWVVSSKWTSNGKSKGKGNKKNGNKYLSWAFSEAAELSRRFDDKVRAYYNKK